LAEWFCEHGIGENRAALIEGDVILEAAIERPGELRAGSVVTGRLREIPIPGRRGLVEAGAHWLFVEPLPAQLTQGQEVRVEVTREAIAEPGHVKRAKGRITEDEEREGPSLAERLGRYRRLQPTGQDLFQQAGWGELIEEAVSGRIAFPGGELRMSLTPAMTLLDVDGWLPPEQLAVGGAEAAGQAIRRLDVTGSIGIDLPTLPKAERQRAAAALDAVLPQPFERTAVNGFGFLQLVRRRRRPSIPELLRDDPIGGAARMLLRQAERVPGAGARELIGAPAVIALLADRQDWRDELARRTGAAIRLRADPAATTWGGHVQAVPH
jgi:hypothetical protein